LTLTTLVWQQAKTVITTSLVLKSGDVVVFSHAHCGKTGHPSIRR
jgi:hypothetical protein